MKLENNKECFVQLWRELERTRRLLTEQNKRFCIRNVLKMWLGARATDMFIFDVCTLCNQEGWNVLPPFALYPNQSRNFLRAFVSAKLKIGYKSDVDKASLDAAYNIAFPNNDPINLNKRPNKLVKNRYGENVEISNAPLRALYAWRTLQDFEEFDERTIGIASRKS